MFYLLGKTDEQKYHYVISVVSELNIMMTDVDKQAKAIRETFNNADAAIKFYQGEKMRQVMDKTRSLHASLTSKVKTITEEATKVFEDQTELIRGNIAFIIIFYSVAIAFSFVALFLTTSVPRSPNSNLLIWFSLISSVFYAVATSHFYTDR